MRAKTLSPREDEILALAAQGNSSKEIAARLEIAESTVNWHVSNALTKLEASNRTEAVAKVLRGEAESPKYSTDRAAAGRRAPRALRLVPVVLIVLVLLVLGGAVGLAGTPLLQQLRGAPPPPAMPTPASAPASPPGAPAQDVTPMPRGTAPAAPSAGPAVQIPAVLETPEVSAEPNVVPGALPSLSLPTASLPLPSVPIPSAHP
jgi:DNA-binding CsgD family transcriptional regulator